MVAEWTVVTRGTFTVHVARVAGCDLSILGEDGAWLWLVSRGDDPDTLAELEQCRVNVLGTTTPKTLIVLGGFFGCRWSVVKTFRA